MKLIKNLFKFLGATLILLVLLLALIPYLFKDKIVEQVRLAINENVNATVDFSDVNISLLKDFPNLKVDVEDITVDGKDKFEGQRLFKSKSTAVSVDIWSLINDDPYKINNISLEDANINVVVLRDGMANYDIAIVDPNAAESTEPLQYVLELDNYSVKNANISYDDRLMDFQLTLREMDHSGSGDFTQDIFDLDTKSDIKAMTVTMENVTYMKNVHAVADAKINMDLPNLKYSLKDNKIFLNALELKGNGVVQLAGEDMLIDADISAPNNEFKDFLSVIPNAFTKEFDDVQTKGTANIAATIKGRYSAVSETFPLIKMNLNVIDGYVKYPDLPQDISNVNVDMKFETFDKKMNSFLLDIPRLNMLIGKNPITGKFRADGNTSNPKFDGVFNGLVDLKVINEAFPVADVNEMSGTIDADFSLAANMNDILNNNFNAIKFTGDAKADKVNVQYANYPKVVIPSAGMNASPAAISLQADNMRLGKSDLSVNSDLKNPLAYFLADKKMEGTVKMRSKKFNANEWIVEVPATDDTEVESVPASLILDENTENILTQSNLIYDVSMDEVLYDEYKINDLQSTGRVGANDIQINNFSAKVNESDFQANGNLTNAYNYMMKNDTLHGNVKLKSDYINANEFMTESATPAEGEVVSYNNPIIPKNIDVEVTTNINKMKYTNLDLENIKGAMLVQGGDVKMQDVSTRALGGNMKFDGLYSTSNPEDPNFSFKYNLAEMQFSQTFQKLLTVKKLAPVMEYIEGLFNSTLVMSGSLGENMMPNMNTLNASGFIETLDGVVKGLAPVEKLVDKLGIKELRKLTLENTKNWFEIKDGKFEVKEFDYTYNDIAMKIGGSHSLTNDMSYSISAAVPRALLASNAVTNAANVGLGLLEKEASKLGLNIDQGDYINLDINIGGTIKSPKVSVKPVSSGGVSLKDAATAEINKNLDEAKDKAKAEADKKIQEAKDSISNVVNKQVDNAKAKAEEEAKKAAQKAKDAVKDKVSDQVDSLATQVLGDSIKEKALDKVGDVLGEGAKEEVDKVKDKIKGWNPFKKGGE